MTATLYRVLLSGVVTRARLVALGALGALPVLLALSMRGVDAADPSASVQDAVVRGYCLGLLAPVVALVLAAAVLGDLVDDRSLVHVWLTPVPRWRIVLAGLAAALTPALPLVVLPAAIALAVVGAGAGVVAASAAVTALAVVTYAALFLGLGLRVRRALVWGLAYVLIWEGAVARVAGGAARLSVQVHAQSLLAELTASPAPRNAATAEAAVVTSLAITAAALAVTTAWLRDAEVS